MPHRHGCFTGRRLAAFVTAGLLLTAVGSVYAQAPVTPPGSGTQSNPYLISQLGHLVWMGNNVSTSSGKYYSLTADIDASATAGWNDAGTDTDVLGGFKPIGTYSDPDTTSFRGVFDGNGHTINGLVINRPTADYVGLFGRVGIGGQVRNLGLASGVVKGRDYVGGLAADNHSGTVSNCYATGAVTGLICVGGLVGYNSSGTISSCYATGAVTGTGSYVGGLVGYGDFGTVSNSYWDTQTSGRSRSYGGTGRATAQMKQQATFAGWDFASVWGIVEGSSYPYLRSSPPPFELTVNISGHGSVTIDPPSTDGTYTPGTVVTLTAVPDGSTDAFIRWAGAVPSESPTVTVVMDIHRSVTAVFGSRIEISSLADLAKIGNDPGYPLVGVVYALTADIDASATAGWNDAGTDTTVLEGFRPIGTYPSSSPDTTSFRGFFDGNGHTISGLVINRPATNYVGLIGYVGSTGQVRNLGLLGGAVTGKDHVGGLVGYNSYSTISSCYATGAVTGAYDVGGLVGGSYYGTVSDCYATGAVAGSSDVGGLVGYNYSGTVSNSYATGAVTVVGMGTNPVGGLVGESYYGTVSKCYATGAVTGAFAVGGLVGYITSSSTVSDCYATGAVTGVAYVGGLVGSNGGGTVSSCYATGAVAVTGTGNYVGGLVGLESYGTVSNSFWDTQTSGRSTSAAGTGKTTAEMKQQATFAGWDFTAVWGVVEGTSYPYLRSSPPPFKLTLHISGPGSVTVNPPSTDGTYALGALVTLTAVPSGPTDVFFRWEGAGPSESPTVTIVMDTHRSVAAVFGLRIEINSLADLARIGNDPGYPLRDVLYVLTADIDASSTATWNDAGTGTEVLEGFKPIGTPRSTGFRGVFDGNGHTISGLVVNRQAMDDAGLFGAVVNGGQVLNLALAGGRVAGRGCVGGLIGYSFAGTVSNCCATGAVTGTDVRVGGLVGECYYGTVLNCCATGAVAGVFNVGGLVGYGDPGCISDCYATGAVTGADYVGALIGYNHSGTVSNCHATGAVTGTGSNVRGLVGLTTNGTVSNSFWDTQTSGRSTSGGGDGKTTAEMKQQPTFAGWDFAGLWSIVEGTSYPYLRFSPPPFKLTVSISGPGSVAVDPPSADGTYPAGTVVTLTAAPSEPTDVFLRWAGAGPSESPTVSVVVDTHRSVTAVFGPRIEVNSLADLAKIGNDPGYPLADVLYVLTGDIDASATAGWNDAGTGTDVLEGFKPIGTYSSPDTASFRGIFDGNGRTISGFVVNRPATDYVGLFGCVGVGGQVRDLGLVVGAVKGKGYVGGLVGENFSGTVSNCYAIGAIAVRGTGNYVGGLVGYGFYGRISNCYATVAATGSGFVGGLVGGNARGTVSNCYATGAIAGSSYVGGLGGYNDSGTVSNCYAIGAVTGNSSVGGLVGYRGSGTTSNSYWDMQTSRRSTSAGGTGKTTAEMKQQSTFTGWDFATLWGITENVTYPFLRSPVATDFDRDRDVDIDDFLDFKACFNGPNRRPKTDCAVAADLDGDTDVDLMDFAIFRACFNGSNRPPNCP